MKKSELIKIVKEEIRKELREAYGMESLYYSSPSGFEQATRASDSASMRIRRFDNVEKWKVIAMQLGARIVDRGDDWMAEMPDRSKLGTFSKLNQSGTLTL